MFFTFDESVTSSICFVLLLIEEEKNVLCPKYNNTYFCCIIKLLVAC